MPPASKLFAAASRWAAADVLRRICLELCGGQGDSELYKLSTNQQQREGCFWVVGSFVPLVLLAWCAIRTEEVERLEGWDVYWILLFYVMLHGLARRCPVESSQQDLFILHTMQEVDSRYYDVKMLNAGGSVRLNFGSGISLLQWCT